VKALAEAQEERFIDALIADDVKSLVQTYRTNPTLLPPLDPQVGGQASEEVRVHVTVPERVKDLPNGTHELIIDDCEIQQDPGGKVMDVPKRLPERRVAILRDHLVNVTKPNDHIVIGRLRMPYGFSCRVKRGPLVMAPCVPGRSRVLTSA
jgi:hypothetical protein